MTIVESESYVSASKFAQAHWDESLRGSRINRTPILCSRKNVDHRKIGSNTGWNGALNWQKKKLS